MTSNFIRRFSMPNHHTELLANFRSIYCEQKFYDVVLQAEGHFIGAHKTILSSCSNYLRDILKESLNDRTVITLDGFSFTEVKIILAFMYTGELKLPETQLVGFLKNAEA